ncbi:AFG1 like ATPase a isoform X3 [Danio rerio]
MQKNLRGYNNDHSTFFSKFISKRKPPKGYYIFGDVGTGKTMVMDMFFNHVETEKKKRVHFHGFMLDVHKHLYKNGLQRVNFVPFIAVLKEYCQTLRLDSGIDYRRRNRPAAGKLFYLSSEPDVDATLDKLFDEMAFKQNDITRPRSLKVHGRILTLDKACGTIADCTFEELCDRPIGASDYLEISAVFDTVFIRNIPLLTLNKKTQARRFITLIDTLYEHKVRVVLKAETPLDDLFVHEHHDDHDPHETHVLLDDLGISRDAGSSLAIFTGEEEVFAFQRTVSRLTEMQTEEYWVAGDRSTN